MKKALICLLIIVSTTMFGCANTVNTEKISDKQEINIEEQDKEIDIQDKEIDIQNKEVDIQETKTETLDEEFIKNSLNNKQHLIKTTYISNYKDYTYGNEELIISGAYGKVGNCDILEVNDYESGYKVLAYDNETYLYSYNTESENCYHLNKNIKNEQVVNKLSNILEKANKIKHAGTVEIENKAYDKLLVSYEDYNYQYNNDEQCLVSDVSFFEDTMFMDTANNEDSFKIRHIKCLDGNNINYYIERDTENSNNFNIIDAETFENIQTIKTGDTIEIAKLNEMYSNDETYIHVRNKMPYVLIFKNKEDLDRYISNEQQIREDKAEFEDYNSIVYVSKTSNNIEKIILDNESTGVTVYDIEYYKDDDVYKINEVEAIKYLKELPTENYKELANEEELAIKISEIQADMLLKSLE